jgi:transposase
MELGVGDNSLTQWVQKELENRGQGAKQKLSKDERAELTELRREVQTLRMERAILKKAAAFFAKESQ